jgi:hypothetical protein
MSSVAELLAAYDSAPDATKRARIVGELGYRLPDRRALDGILRAVEGSTGSGPAEETIRITGVKLLGRHLVESPADRVRVLKVLTRLARTSPSWVERLQVLDTCRTWMGSSEIRSLIYDLVLNEKDKRVRGVAMQCHWAIRPGTAPQAAINLCKRLLTDPDLRGTARECLRYWSKKRSGRGHPK